MVTTLDQEVVETCVKYIKIFNAKNYQCFVFLFFICRLFSNSATAKAEIFDNEVDLFVDHLQELLEHLMHIFLKVNSPNSPIMLKNGNVFFFQYLLQWQIHSVAVKSLCKLWPINGKKHGS